MTSISKIALNNTEYSLEDTSARSSLDNLATVATTGDYDDLTNKPTVYHPDLLSFQWSDHILNNVSWLRADTFSWQDGTVYEAAYEHLTDDITGITPTTETIGSNTITVYVASDGHKIVLEDQEQTVQDIYDETGVAWYFILDTTNQRFKLPRTKYGFVGLRDTVGKYVPESLPNIKGEKDLTWNTVQGNAGSTLMGTDWSSTGPFGIKARDGNKTWASSNNSSTSDTLYSILTFDANKCSSTYQDNAPVQQRATQMYLYFYVGQFSQSAIEQTAGITSEQLNAKVDISSLSECQVIIETYHNEGDWYRIWSDGWIEQGGIKTSTSQTSITLLKQFSDTNYTVTGAITDSTSATGDNSIVIGNITSSGFTIYSVSKTRWYACGY